MMATLAFNELNIYARQQNLIFCIVRPLLKDMGKMYYSIANQIADIFYLLMINRYMTNWQ